MEEHEKGIP